MPYGSKIGNALDWLDSELRDDPEVDAARKLKLIEQVSLKFDLSPIDEKYLRALLKVNVMRPEEIRLAKEAIQKEIRELETGFVEKKTALLELMKKCKHPDERTDQDNNLYCPDCGHFD